MRDQICRLFSNEEKRIASPQSVYPFPLARNFFFQEEGKTITWARSKVASNLRSIRNYSKLAPRSIWRFGPRLEDLLYRRFIIDEKTRHVSRCIDDEDIPFTESQASSVYIISRLYHYRGLENVCKYFAKRNGQWAAYGRI